MALADTLTTREALRRAVLEDLVARCDLAAVVMEGGPLDGLQVVSMGILRDQVSGHLMVELGAPSEHTAEVKTPATIFTSALCPECDLPVEITVKLTPQLSVDDDGAEISVKAKSKARAHLHGQLSLSEADGQASMDDVVIDDLRLRILRAVADVGDAHAVGVVGVPPPSLDVIAIHLKLATDADRGDLEESLYRYAQLEEPLVEVISIEGEPVTYVLTEAGIAFVAAADADGDDEDEPGADLGESDDDLRKRIEGDGA